MGSILTQHKSCTGCLTTGTTNANKGWLFEQVLLQSSKRSLWQKSLKLNLSQISIRRMFKKIVILPRRQRLGNVLNPAGKEAKIMYCPSILAMVCKDPVFLSSVWCSNESHIPLNGFNNQHTIFSGFEWSDIILKKPLQSVAKCVASANSYQALIFLRMIMNIIIVCYYEHMQYREKLSHSF